SRAHTHTHPANLSKFPCTCHFRASHSPSHLWERQIPLLDAVTLSLFSSHLPLFLSLPLSASLSPSSLSLSPFISLPLPPSLSLSLPLSPSVSLSIPPSTLSPH